MLNPAPGSRDEAIRQFAERTGVSVEDAASLWSVLHGLAVSSDAEPESMARILASALSGDGDSIDTDQGPRIIHVALSELRRVDSAGVPFSKAASSPRIKRRRVLTAADDTNPDPVFEHDGTELTIFATRGGALRVESTFADCVFHIGSAWVRAELVSPGAFADLTGLSYSALREEWEGGSQK